MATLVRSISQNGGVICTAIDSTDIAAKSGADSPGLPRRLQRRLGPSADRCVTDGSHVKKPGEFYHDSSAGRRACRPFDRSYRRIRECPRRCGASGGGNSFKWKRKAGCGWCGGKKTAGFP